MTAYQAEMQKYADMLEAMSEVAQKQGRTAKALEYQIYSENLRMETIEDSISTVLSS